LALLSPLWRSNDRGAEQPTGSVVIALFAMLLWRGLLIARRAADPFGSLLATGIVAWIGFQVKKHAFPSCTANC
jgi:hypothetical protein